nr:dTMP kinase [Nanoarchaeum sp.]
MERGRFIVLEGIDGSGKNTQLSLITRELFDLNKRSDLKQTREPWKSEYGIQIREILHSDLSPEDKAEECFDLYVKDRALHVQMINDEISQGNVLISDRYYYSSIAYQQAQGIELERIIQANMVFPTPDLTIVFKISAENAMKRIKKNRTKQEKFEQLEFLTKVGSYFDHMQAFADRLDTAREAVNPDYKKENLVFIDANRKPERVYKEIEHCIEYQKIREEIERIQARL